ncbi:MAG: RNA-guided pseudouridylation complex pseudouridine synthase subunit Cbf5 [Candidatus Aenigmatarchaeota archaeon]
MIKWIVRSNESSLTSFGKYPGARSTEELLHNGLILLDKVQGPTSHQVDNWMKALTGVGKCSHGGTLDPRVSGVLVIALENATKLMPILLSCKKEYVALIYLHADVPEQKIRNALQEFIGKIKQLPPKKSAVARRVREREIYNLEVLQIAGRNVLIRVGCEAGTYIRRIADDLGKNLGCGAHLQELRRTRSGIFDEGQIHTLQELADAMAEWKERKDDNRLRQLLLPMERLTDGMKAVIVKDGAIGAIANGAPLAVGGIVRVQEGIEKGDIVAMLSLKGEFIAFGPALISSMEMAKLNKGLAVKTDKVLIAQGTYPRKW